MRIVCISDTHNEAEERPTPDGEILIHAGDLTMSGSVEEVERAHAWLARLPHRHKIVIAGNHDFLFERQPETARRIVTGVTYLLDELVEIEGLRIWGSPWQPWFYDWAFNLQRGAEIRAKWDLIPDGIDILITHGPPAGHGDRTSRGDSAGCEDLLGAIRRVAPSLHVFGHIHEGYGMTREGRTVCVNASTCDAAYRPTNEPVVIEWPPKEPRS